MSYENSIKAFEKACTLMPGGVNSPARAFGAVGGCPVFFERGEGAYLYDIDGNRYIDFVGSWGPMILGHCHPAVVEALQRAIHKGTSFGAPTVAENELCELVIDAMPSVEMVRLVNSGTEAVMSAIRAARGFTGKDKIIKFAGCYHGHSDALLVAAGSGLMTQGIPGSAGVPEGCTKDTLTAVYNDLDSVRQLFEANPNEIAAVIVEPVGANMGVVLPEDGFLEGLRKLCDENEALLIFDEVITGFRLARGGAQERYGIQADITNLGKIIRGGMPVGAYGGRREIMDKVAPTGSVYQAGTLSGNPVAMTAGLTTLKTLNENPDIYDRLEAKGAKLEAAYRAKFGGRCCVNRVGSIMSAFFTPEKVIDYDTAVTSNTEAFGRYFRYMLENGIYIAPSQFEAMFLSDALTDEDIDRTIEVLNGYEG